MRMITGLRSIIGLYSFKDAISDVIIGYYNDSIIREIVTFQTYREHPIEILYISCFSLFIVRYIRLTYIRPQTIREIKIKNIDEYKVYMKFIKLFIIIFTVIFTKDIENAI